MGKELDLVAIDLGASSGRAMLGQFDGERVRLRELHRFSNGPVALPDGIHWDVLGIWSDVKRGLALAAREPSVELAGVGIDTWGVDFGLLDRGGALIGNPYHYRDSRTDGMLKAAFERVPQAQIFGQTGIQFMEFNTLYQLLSMVLNESAELEIAESLLMMPDLLNYWLTGRKVGEFSICTTSQCYDTLKGDWAWTLLEALGIPTDIFPEVIPSASIVGEMLPSVAQDLGMAPIPVLAPACHDTGSAVAAVPATGAGFAYVSCGTWSLMGTELATPLVNEGSLRLSLTNEGGVCDTFRFLKNITGLWLVQECRRQWSLDGEKLSWDELTIMASEAEPLRAVIDPDCPDFLKLGDMPARICACCDRTGQWVPESKGEIIRCALEGLALKYRWVLEGIEDVMGRHLSPLHLVGGGIRNKLLCQFAADATGREVIAGPVEATAIGNILTQVMALGELGSLAELRQVVRNSFEIIHYEPSGDPRWEDAYARLGDLMSES